MEAKVSGSPQDVRVAEIVQIHGNVHVVGVQIGFGEMVVLLVKFALAAIPAAIMLTALFVGLVAIVGGVFRHH